MKRFLIKINGKTYDAEVEVVGTSASAPVAAPAAAPRAAAPAADTDPGAGQPGAGQPRPGQPGAAERAEPAEVSLSPG